MRTTKTPIFVLFSGNLTVVATMAEAIVESCQPVVVKLIGRLYIESFGLESSAEKTKRSQKFQKTVQNQLIDSNHLPWKTDMFVLTSFRWHPHVVFPVRNMRPVPMEVLM
jgi:hypothetical protein